MIIAARTDPSSEAWKMTEVAVPAMGGKQKIVCATVRWGEATVESIANKQLIERTISIGTLPALPQTPGVMTTGETGATNETRKIGRRIAARRGVSVQQEQMGVIAGAYVTTARMWTKIRGQFDQIGKTIMAVLDPRAGSPARIAATIEMVTSTGITATIEAVVATENAATTATGTAGRIAAATIAPVTIGAATDTVTSAAATTGTAVIDVTAEAATIGAVAATVSATGIAIGYAVSVTL